MVVYLLVIVLLVLVNALYVLAEFAAVSVSRARVQEKAREGQRLARRLLPHVENATALDRYIAACQIGITVSSLVLGAYGQATLAVALGPVFVGWSYSQAAAESIAATIVLILLTIFQMVLGELVPKSIALQYPTRVALLTLLPMEISLRAFSWFIALLNGSGMAVLRLFGMKEAGHRHIHSPEEIELLIAEGHAAGLFGPEEQQRLRRALRLNSRPVRQLMVPFREVVGLDVNTPAEQVVQAVTTSGFTRLLAYRGTKDDVVGIVHTRDIARAHLERGNDWGLEELVRPVPFVFHNTTADRVLSLMRARRTQMAIVVNDLDSVAGLVTVEDLVADFLGLSAGKTPAERLPDGRVRLPGRMRLDDAEPWTGPLWVGRADTVAGRVLEAFGRIPQPGERTNIQGVAVEVERVNGVVVESVLITPVPRASEEES